MNIPKEFQKSEEDLYIFDKYGIVKKNKTIDFEWDYLLGVNLGYFYGCFIAYYPEIKLEPSELNFIKKCKLAMISDKNNLICIERKSNYKSPDSRYLYFQKRI
jgi:hypothetical protein